MAETLTQSRIELKQKLASLLREDFQNPNSIIKSFKPDFYQRIESLLDLNRPALIAISGESASGKTTFLKRIKEQAARIQERRENIILSTIKGDNYFNDISEGINKYGGFDELLATGYNPDAPSSFQLELMRSDLSQLILGKTTKVPRYVLNGTGVSIPEALEIKPAEVIIVEGMCSLYDDIHDVFDLKIYVDIDADVQEERFLNRCAERNQTKEDGKKQLAIVTESAKQFIRPTQKHADVVINGSSNLETLKIFVANLLKAFQHHSLEVEAAQSPLNS